MLLWQVQKVTQRINVEQMHDETSTRLKINKQTTTLHILVLFALTLNYIKFIYLDKNTQEQTLVYERAFTMQFFILGVQDTFVSYMLWFLLDNQQRPLFKEDKLTGLLYPIINVVKHQSGDIEVSSHSINDIEDNLLTNSERQTYFITPATRMIAQFVN